MDGNVGRIGRGSQGADGGSGHVRRRVRDDVLHEAVGDLGQGLELRCLLERDQRASDGGWQGSHPSVLDHVVGDDPSTAGERAQVAEIGGWRHRSAHGLFVEELLEGSVVGVGVLAAEFGAVRLVLLGPVCWRVLDCIVLRHQRCEAAGYVVGQAASNHHILLLGRRVELTGDEGHFG